MNKKLIKQNAKEKLNGKFGSLLLINVFMFLMMVFSNIIPVLGMLITYGPIKLSYYKILNKVSNNKQLKWQDYFVELRNSFKNQWGQTYYLQLSNILYCWPALVVGLLGLIVGSIVTSVGVGIAASNWDLNGIRTWSVIGGVIIALSILLSIILYIIISLRTKMGFYILQKETKLDGKQALDKSAKYMAGHEFEYFGFQLSMIVYYIQNIFFGYGIPMIDLSSYDFFDTLYKQDENQPQ